MSKKSKWGVKWDVVGIGAALLFGAGIPAAIFYFGFNTIYMWLCAAAFTGLLAMIWGLMGEGAKYWQHTWLILAFGHSSRQNF